MKYFSYTKVTSYLLTIGFLALAACAENEKTTKDKRSDEADGRVSERVIYGDDDRRDLYQVQDDAQLRLAASTVALVSDNTLTTNNDGTTTLLSKNFRQTYNLCPTEPYRDQGYAAFCSGFLVGPNLIATAGHCIRSQSDCNFTKFVFGFSKNSPSTQNDRVPTKDVYACKRIVKTLMESSGADYAVIELDRVAADRAPLPVRRSGEVAVGNDLVVIGHPSGLPTKVAGGASVRSLNDGYFVANLNTYGGNSGSAVFNARTGTVEGILVRGENDFVSQGTCRVSNRCSNTGCRGEDVTKITEVLDYIPNLDGGGEEPEPEPTERVYTSKQAYQVPDNSTRGITSTINAAEAPNGRKVLVQVNITHTWRGDLLVSVVAPDGKEVVLSNRVGRSQQNLIGTFGEELAADLTKLSGVTAAGAWKLKVSDRATRDTGTLHSWSLIFR